jgi:hypothetical protein
MAKGMLMSLKKVSQSLWLVGGLVVLSLSVGVLWLILKNQTPAKLAEPPTPRPIVPTAGLPAERMQRASERVQGWMEAIRADSSAQLVAEQMRVMTTALTADEVEDLLYFIGQPPVAHLAEMRAAEIYNEACNALLRQEQLPVTLGPVLEKNAAEHKWPGVFRQYSIQHLGALWWRVSAEEKQRIEHRMWQWAQDPAAEGIAAQSLREIARWQGEQSKLQAQASALVAIPSTEPVLPRWEYQPVQAFSEKQWEDLLRKYVETASSPPEVVMVSIESARLHRWPWLAPALRARLADEKTPFSVQLVSIAALGECGDSADRELIQRCAPRHRELQSPVRAALAQLPQ